MTYINGSQTLVGVYNPPHEILITELFYSSQLNLDSLSIKQFLYFTYALDDPQTILKLSSLHIECLSMVHATIQQQTKSIRATYFHMYLDNSAKNVCQHGIHSLKLESLAIIVQNLY